MMAALTMHLGDSSFNHTAHEWQQLYSHCTLMMTALITLHLGILTSQELHQQLTFFASVTCDDHAATSASFLWTFAVVVAVGVIIVHLLFPHPGLVGVMSQGLSTIACFHLCVPWLTKDMFEAHTVNLTKNAFDRFHLSNYSRELGIGSS